MVNPLPEISNVGFLGFIIEVICPLVIVISASNPGSNLMIWSEWKFNVYSISFLKYFAVLVYPKLSFIIGDIFITWFSGS